MERRDAGAALHVLNRLAFGPRPGDLERVESIGPERYIEEQVAAESIPIPASLSRRIDALETLRLTPAELFERYQLPIIHAQKDPEIRRQAQFRSRIVLEQATEARLVRAIFGP